jgi:hypothetical protein
MEASEATDDSSGKRKTRYVLKEQPMQPTQTQTLQGKRSRGTTLSSFKSPEIPQWQSMHIGLRRSKAEAPPQTPEILETPRPRKRQRQSRQWGPVIDLVDSDTADVDEENIESTEPKHVSPVERSFPVSSEATRKPFEESMSHTSSSSSMCLQTDREIETKNPMSTQLSNLKEREHFTDEGLNVSDSKDRSASDRLNVQREDEMRLLHNRIQSLASALSASETQLQQKNHELQMKDGELHVKDEALQRLSVVFSPI